MVVFDDDDDDVDDDILMDVYLHIFLRVTAHSLLLASTRVYNNSF